MLRRAGEYVAAYERDGSAIVADEGSMQTSSDLGDSPQYGFQARRVRADVLTVHDGAGWAGFRDVYEVDGTPVRPRSDRLARLFLEPQSDSRAQASRITAESARFNLHPEVSRTINLPPLALQFLRPLNQRRPGFKIAGTKTAGGTTMMIVSFRERVMPRMIRTADNAAASGRFWIEPESGRIVESELFLSTRKPGNSVSALIHVAYAADPHLNAWVPVSMTETYRGGAVLIEGRAVYSSFRRFAVTVDSVFKRPEQLHYQDGQPY